jgi:hypothetical protein
LYITNKLCSIGNNFFIQKSAISSSSPGLEIPFIECSPTPFEYDNIKYHMGDDTTTTLNLLDWATELPLSYSTGWTGYNGTDYENQAHLPAW